MEPVLHDLYRHQAWANAEHWRAIRGHEPAARDPAIYERLHHITLVTQAFNWLAAGAQGRFDVTKASDYADLAALAVVARRADEEALAIVRSSGDEALAAPVTVPWFKSPSLSLPLAQALLQSAMHSQWHRGQNATRLRELGGTPPPTDLIYWYWKERPDAAWD
jgi:uncharacterized damage-inducible protein DinB